MAAPQETALKEINPELKNEAIQRAARFIKGIKLAASAMSEVWWTDTSGAVISANTSASRGNFVLFPKMAITLMHTTEPSAEPQRFSATNEPVELETVRLVTYISHNNTVILAGATPPRSSQRPNNDQPPETAFETVTFSPDDHQLALYIDERR